MTKKQYFVFLWVLIFVAVVAQAAIVFMADMFIDQSAPAELIPSTSIMFLILFSMMHILICGFAMAAGFGFAEKIGARLLFLDGNYNFIKDIFKPAVFVGIAYAGVVLIINAVVPVASIRMLADERSHSFLYKSLLVLPSVITHDVVLLLFCLSGLALLIKKITKNISMTVIQHVSVVLVALLYNGYSLMMWFGTMSMVDPMVNFGIDMIVGVLFWKNGFETAVLCHIVIATILYLIAPVVVFALGA